MTRLALLLVALPLALVASVWMRNQWEAWQFDAKIRAADKLWEGVR